MTKCDKQPDFDKKPICNLRSAFFATLNFSAKKNLKNKLPRLTHPPKHA